jgi:RNA polymerase subunit RPABC4/transcription elongation factor Spt4
MSDLRSEFQVADRTGVVVSEILAVAAAAAFLFVADDPPFPIRILLAILIGVVMFIYGFLVSYVYSDAKRRGMRHVLWALIAFFVPNALGFIAYFLLREPLLQPCAACGATARRDFAFCPQCGSPLPRACPSCHRPVEPIWAHCAHCGQKLLREPVAAGNAAL